MEAQMTEKSLGYRDSKFEYKVNEVQFESEVEFLSANEILEKAANKGEIPGKPDEYALQGEKGRYTGDEKIDLRQDNIFITIPITPPPVA